MTTRAQSKTGVLSNRNLAIASALLLAVVILSVGRGQVQMGIGQWADVPLLAQVHLASMMAVTLLGIPLLVQAKGTPRHRLLGRIWAGLMWGNAVLTLFFRAGSNRLGGLFIGDVSPIHALSLFVAIMVPVAVLRARRHDRKGHESAIRGLIIGSLIIAGSFTFLPGRLLGYWLFRA
jgi:uncharacterized membrane protein